MAGNSARVPLSTLQKICEALTEQEILDLGANSLGSPDSASQKKLEIYRSYVPVMIALRAKKVGENKTILPLIRRFFLLLPSKVRREVLAREMTNKDPKLQVAAVRIGGETRDPELAPFLAPLLKQKELRPMVQEALARLTLRSELFTNEKEFQAWWATHKGKSFESLAEESLLLSLHRGKKIEDKFRQTTLAFAEKAIELGLQVRPLPWESFQSLLLQLEDPKDRASMAKTLFLGLLHLSGSDSSSGPWKPTDSGLKEFFQFARTEYESSRGSKTKENWLSLVTLLGKALGGKSGGWARLNLETLLQEKKDLDLRGVLSLLELFPTDDARDAILNFIEGELRQNLPQTSQADSLGFAIEVLGRMGPPEDRSLLKGIRDLSLRMVRTKGFPMKLREAALDLGGKLDGPGVLEGFQPIVLAGSEEIPSSLRMRAFGWVETLGTGMLQAEKGPSAIAAAEQILAFFFKCLGDPEPRLREQVCKALESFPPSPKNFPEEKRREWGGRILGRVGMRLRVEKEPQVIDSLRRVFHPTAENRLLGATVLEHFVGILLHWGAKRRAEYEKQLPAFLKDLELLLKGKRIPPKTLVAFARSLKNAGLKRPSALILDAPALVNLDAGADLLPESQRVEALRTRKERAALFLSLLLEEGMPEAWSLEKKKAEAPRILGAKKGLLNLAGESPRALFFLAWAELFSGNAPEAESLLNRFRSTKPAPPPKVLEAATLMQARALLQIGKPKAAAALLAPRKDLKALLLLLEARKAAGDHKGVVSLVRDLLQSPSLPASGPKHVDLLLDLAQAQIAMKDLKACLDTVKNLPLLNRESAKSRLKLIRDQIKTLQEKLAKKKEKSGPQSVPSKKNILKRKTSKPKKADEGAGTKGSQQEAKKGGGRKTKKGSK